jgi:hypothetical protein
MCVLTATTPFNHTQFTGWFHIVEGIVPALFSYFWGPTYIAFDLFSVSNGPLLVQKIILITPQLSKRALDGELRPLEPLRGPEGDPEPLLLPY